MAFVAVLASAGETVGPLSMEVGSPAQAVKAIQAAAIITNWIRFVLIITCIFSWVENHFGFRAL